MSSSRRHASVAAEPVTSVLSPSQVPVYDSPANSDDDVLAALGYKPEFKRHFSLWTTFCVSFAVLGLLPSFASTLYYGMGYAGTAGMVWGWIIAMVFIQCIAMAMAELCSSMPTSGGLYYAAAVLAPPGWGPLAAWITGWSNWLVQVTGGPSVNFGIASMTLAAASINDPTYVPQDYQVFLLTTFLMVSQSVLVSMPTKSIAQLNSYGSTFNMIALVIVIILIPSTTNREEQGLPKFTPAKEVWGTIYPGTDWPNGIAILMSFVSVLWTMSGYDAPFHLSEECSNANIAAPRAIVLTSAIGGLFGWFLQIVVAYTVIDIDSVLESDLGQPFAAYLLQVLPRNAALAILGLTIVCGFSMGQGCMVAASRVSFAYARDGCFPFSDWIATVNKRTKTPVNAVWFNCAVGVALTLLIFGGEYAIGAIFSIGAVAAAIAFNVPIFIRVFLVGDRFRPGPWNLGRWSPFIGGMGCVFTLVMVPVLCFPSLLNENLDTTTMNWTCLVYGGPMFGAMVWWFVSARKWFKGPRVNIEHMMLGREGNVVEGKEVETFHGKDGDVGSSGSDGERDKKNVEMA